MKKNVLILVMTIMFCVTQSNVITNQTIIVTTQYDTNFPVQEEHQKEKIFFKSERYLRRKLYWLEKHNPLFFKLHSIRKNLDYYIAIITEHIKVLEHKIMRNPSGLESNAMMIGSILSCFSVALASTAYKTLHMNSAIPSEAEQALMGSVILSISSTFFALLAGKEFYKAYRRVERMIDRLERDQRILTILQKEKLL